MKISEPIKDCRYWGYEPASGELKDAIGTIGIDRVRVLRDQFREECKTIKASGRKSTQYGFKTMEAAKDAALLVEAGTGVEMRVFNHDYL